MNFVLHSVTHYNCPLDLREKLHLPPSQQQAILKHLHTQESVSEALLLETCNRLEFYLYVQKAVNTTELLCSVLDEHIPDSSAIFREYQNKLEGKRVIKHLFKVAAGLDSQIPGEDQVLAQLKSAYSMAIDSHTTGLVFHRLLHHAFRAGKAVRTETDINSGALSIALAAVDIARDALDLPDSKILVVGAGQNAEIACRGLIKHGGKDITIANRNSRNAKSLIAKLKTGKTIPLSQIPQKINDYDLIISSTSCPEYILTSQSKNQIRKPVVIIDIAVPRDIDPKIAESNKVTLYNLEDINRIVRKNYDKRNHHTEKAEKIVEEFQDKFERWHKSLNTAPVIKKLNKKTLNIARSEARRYASNFGDENYNQLEIFAESLAKKIMHQPIDFIKNQHNSGNEHRRNIDLVNKMFDLEDKKQL